MELDNRINYPRIPSLLAAPFTLIRLLWFLSCFVLSTPHAIADGKVFSSVAVMDPATTPDQSALLYFSNKLETLVIETSIAGSGSNFAWVVPFPSAPKIQSVSPSFFQSLKTTYQPRLNSKVSNKSTLYLSFGAVLSLSILTRRIGGKVWGAMRIALPVLIVFLCVLAVGRMGALRSGAAGYQEVTVVDTQTVGVFDTVTLSGKDGRALLDWLNEHHFRTPESALPIISSYATQNWVFVAATISRNSSATNTVRPHPLAFTFPSERAVYPLKLTGIENGKCSIELYVFGDTRAELPSYHVEYSGPTQIVEDESDPFEGNSLCFTLPHPGEFRISNPEISKLIGPNSVTTKLSGTLGPNEMKNDAWIQWVAPKEEYPILYTRGAANSGARDQFVLWAVVGALILQLIAPRLGSTLGCLALVGIVAAALFIHRSYLNKLTITDKTFRRYYAGSAKNQYRQFAGAVDQLLLERKEGLRKSRVPLATADLLDGLKPYLVSTPVNCFTGEPMRDGTTPGNLMFQKTTNGVLIYWHDIASVPRLLATFDDLEKGQPMPASTK